MIFFVILLVSLGEGKFSRASEVGLSMDDGAGDTINGNGSNTVRGGGGGED